MEYFHIPSCDSTQTELKNYLESKSLTNMAQVAVSTDNQSQGLGRRGRKWLHHPGSIAVSFTWIPKKVITLTSLEIAVLVCRYFEDVFEAPMKVKWPNDLVINNKKCGGIIIELTAEQAIIGLGINLYPRKTKFNESFVFEKENQNFEIKKLLKYLWENAYQKESLIINDWNKLCFHLGKRVEILEGSQRIHGQFKGVNREGLAIVGEEVVLNGSLIIAN